jgi:quinol monooxygenase YgiN
MPKEITSVAFSFIKPEFIGKAVRVYLEAIDNYQSLKGCLGIQLFRKANHLNEFMVISKWRSISEREEYLASGSHKKTVEKLKPYRQSDPIMNNFEQITEIKDN